MTKFFFAQKYSLTTAAGGAGVTYALMEGHYITAAVIFVAAVVIGAWGELRLEKLERSA